MSTYDHLKLCCGPFCAECEVALDALDKERDEYKARAERAEREVRESRDECEKLGRYVVAAVRKLRNDPDYECDYLPAAKELCGLIAALTRNSAGGGA